MIELNSTLQVRHGVMLVGPAGGGKTTTRQILKRALVVLPTIQAREQQQQLGTGDYPEETGSSKTALSYMVRMFASNFACIQLFSLECRLLLWLCIATLRNQLKNLAPLGHPIRIKQKPLAHVFPRFALAACVCFEF